MTDIKSYYHENVVSCTEALNEARSQQNRPQAYVQWGLHGTFLTGGIQDVTVSRLVNGTLMTNTGVDSLACMYNDARKGLIRGATPLDSGKLPLFAGDFTDYMNFSEAIDTRDYLSKKNHVHQFLRSNTLLGKRVIDYPFVPLPEWPEE